MDASTSPIHLPRSVLLWCALAGVPLATSACGMGDVTNPNLDGPLMAMGNPNGSGGPGGGGGSGGGPGGGNDGGGDPVLTASLRHDPGDGVFGDTVGAYVDRTDGVELSLGDRVWFDTHAKGRIVLRELCYDFNIQPLQVFRPDDLADLLAKVPAGGVLCTESLFHTSDGLTGMAVGDEVIDSGKFVLRGIASAKNNGWEWRLRAHDQGEEAGMSITHPDPDTWVFANGVGGHDDVLQLLRVVNGVDVVATYRMTFEVTVTAVSGG